MSDKISKTSEI